MSKKRKVVLVGTTPVAPITAKERKEIARQIREERKQLRKVYPEAMARWWTSLPMGSLKERYT